MRRMCVLRQAVLATLVLPLWIAASGCGGGGGGGTSTSSSAVTGTVIDGPVSGGRVEIKNSSGTVVASGTSGPDGKFSLSIPSGTTFPLNISTSGGTDTVTGEEPAPMDSLLVDSSQATANVTPITSILFNAAVANAGGLGNVTQTVVNTVKPNVLTQFGFGVDSEDSGTDPLTSPVTESNVTSFTRSAVAVGEVLRRAVGPSAATMSQALKAIGEDMADGSMDGKKNNDALSSQLPTGFSANAMVVTVMQQKAIVGAESANNSMELTKSDGSLIPSADVRTKFSQVVNTMVPAVSTSSALTKMDAMPVSEKQKSQLAADIGSSIKIQQSLGTDVSTMTALGNAVNNVQAGKSGPNKFEGSTLTNAGGIVKSAAGGIKSLPPATLANAANSVNSTADKPTTTTSVESGAKTTTTSVAVTPTTTTSVAVTPTTTTTVAVTPTTTTSVAVVPATSVVTVKFGATRTLFGYSLTFTTPAGLTLGKSSDCSSLVSSVSLAAVNTTTKAVVATSNDGFSGPADILKCTFAVGTSVTTAPKSTDFSLAGKESTDGNGTSKSITSSDYTITVN